jgi:hypothetical protein
MLMKRFLIILALVALLAACIPGGPQAPTEAPPTETAPPAVTDVPTAVPTPLLATDTPQPTLATPGATLATPDVEPESYVDNRSGPVEVLQSYFNAINRREYVRAYSYWEAGADIEAYVEFEAGFADTDFVELITGQPGGDAGAGNLFYAVPVVLHVEKTDGTAEAFAGCYILHLSQPGVQATPPFRPLGLRSAEVEMVATEMDTAALLAQICQDNPTSPLPSQPTPELGDISPSHYIDNRSGPVEVLQSLFNAVNRKEYLRAYSYWETSAELPPFPEFEAGYENTESVQLVTGEVSSDAGAGQLYYTVPVTLQAQTTDGSLQTFVGCYTLHLSQPGIQGAPPFQPLSIRSGEVEQVVAEADTAALMAEACTP